MYIHLHLQSLSVLYQSVDSRLRSFDQLLKLNGRVSLLLAQAEQAKRERSSIDNSIGAPMTVYDEDDDDDDDEDDDDESDSLDDDDDDSAGSDGFDDDDDDDSDSISQSSSIAEHDSDSSGENSFSED